MTAYIKNFNSVTFGTQLLASLCFLFVLVSNSSLASNYERDKAVPVEKVLFGKVVSARNITQEALIQDKKNGWKTAKKQPVKNQDLIKPLYQLYKSKKVKFKHVRGHKGIYGNEMADRLAVEGSKMCN